MGFGTEILFLLLLGLIFLGPKQMHSMLRHVARAKAQFDRASHSLREQLDSELETSAQRHAASPAHGLSATSSARSQPLSGRSGD